MRILLEKLQNLNLGEGYSRVHDAILATILRVGNYLKCFLKEHLCADFPGSPVVKNPPTNVGDTGLTPSPGRSHMLSQGN